MVVPFSNANSAIAIQRLFVLFATLTSYFRFTTYALLPIASETAPSLVHRESLETLTRDTASALQDARSTIGRARARSDGTRTRTL